MTKIKKHYFAIGQYTFETKNLEGPAKTFLDETAPLIGYIVHSFNTLEQLLNSVICELISDRSDWKGLMVLYNMNYSMKVDLFKRFVLNMQKSLDKKMPIFENFLEHLKKAGELRNMVIHADWETAFDNGFTACKVKINSHGLQHEYIQFDSESLQQILEYIDNTCEMFDIYEQEYYELFLR